MKLHHADCLEILKALPDRSIDCIITDPPYGHGNGAGLDLISNIRKALGNEEAPLHLRPIANDVAEANDIFRQALPEFARLLKPGAVCCCCCCGGGGPDPQFARWSLWLDEHLDFKQMIVWDKGPMGMGWHYRRSYETVLVAQKPGAACKWYDTSRKIENIIRPGYKGIRKIIPKATDHPTPKPVELAAHFIELHTWPGDTVLDPFMGRGCVGEACGELGREFIGIEIDREHFEIAENKLTPLIDFAA